MPDDGARLVDAKKMPESGGVYGIPLMYRGAVYFGACDSYFYSIDAKTGRKNWVFKANGMIMSTAAAKDDVVYFGCFDECLYALGTDGKLRWKFRTAGIVISSPFIYNGVAYFGSLDNNLYAVDINTQRELWRFRTNDEIIGDPLVYENRIYFGSMDSYFYCLDLAGNLVWKFKTGDSITIGIPVISDGVLYFTSGDHVLYALTLDGVLVWKFYTGGIMYDFPTIYENIIIVGNRERYVYALDKKTGTCIWKFMTGKWAPRPVAFNGRVYVTADKVWCLNTNGFKLWEYDAGITDAEGILITDDGCFFGCGLDAKVCRITHEGQPVWEFRTNGAAAPPSLFKGVIPAPKWNQGIFDEEGKSFAVFNPYTIINKGGILEKFMEEGVDTTLRYGDIGESVGAYKDAEKGGSAGAYRPSGDSGGKKKKNLLDELLETERRDKRFGI